MDIIALWLEQPFYSIYLFIFFCLYFPPPSKNQLVSFDHFPASPSRAERQPPHHVHCSFKKKSTGRLFDRSSNVVMSNQDT